VLIDARHRLWILITSICGALAVGFYQWQSESVPGGLTGGSAVGLWYGILGTALMVFAGALSLLRFVPSWWWIGSRKFWLRGHIWLGLLSGVLILCHSGYHFGGLLEQALWVVLGLTLATGIFGLVLQQFLPRLLTSRLPNEAPYDQLPHLCENMRRQADGLVEKIVAGDIDVSVADLMSSQAGVAAQIRFLEFYGKEVRPFLEQEFRGTSLLASSLQAESRFTYWRSLPAFAKVKGDLDQLEHICDDRRQLANQERLHRWLHAWLLLHIPLSALLLVLTVAHAVFALYY
jgi:hypothetical protein